MSGLYTRLYKRENGKLFYFEAVNLEEKNKTLFRNGEVGGECENFERKIDEEFTNKEIQKYVDLGYEEIDIDDHKILLVEYKIDGFGTDEDLEKRHKLQDELDSVLAWHALGFVDGGSSGSGTMEVCCFVVDFDIAKLIIEQYLEGSEFDDYSRIYDEDEG